MYVPDFFLRQKIALTANRFELRAPQSGGALGELLGVAQQKRMALKEQVTFFADDSGSPLFSVDRRLSMRDHHRVRVSDERVDFRVAAAVAVGLDVLMGR